MNVVAKLQVPTNVTVNFNFFYIRPINRLQKVYHERAAVTEVNRAINNWNYERIIEKCSSR